jgi:hypothetical protein
MHFVKSFGLRYVARIGKNMWQKKGEEFILHSFELSELRIKSQFEITTYNF